MAMIKIEKQSKITVARKSVTVEIPEDAVVKKIGAYEVIDTPNEGIKRIVNRSGGYLVTLDYGRVMKTNKKTGLRELKQLSYFLHTIKRDKDKEKHREETRTE